MKGLQAYLRGPEQDRNADTQVSEWLRLGHGYMTFVAKRTTGLVSIRELMLGQNQRGYMENVNRLHVEHTQVFSKIRDWASSLRPVPSSRTFDLLVKAGAVKQDLVRRLLIVIWGGVVI